jgi:hypothetical protein
MEKRFFGGVDREIRPLTYPKYLPQVVRTLVLTVEVKGFAEDEQRGEEPSHLNEKHESCFDTLKDTKEKVLLTRKT